MTHTSMRRALVWLLAAQNIAVGAQYVARHAVRLTALEKR